VPLTPRVFGQEWLNVNAMRAYPLADTATGLSSDGGFSLPQDLIVDLSFVVPLVAGASASGFYISKLVIGSSSIVIEISKSGELAGVVNIPAATHTKHDTYAVSGRGVLADCIGVITIGSLEQTLNYGGSFEFSQSGGQLLPTLFRPSLSGVRAIRVVNGSDVGPPLYGVIRLESGRNVRLDVQEASGLTPQTIRISALSAIDLNEACGCTSQTPTPEPVRTINGVPAREDGSFTIDPGNCIKLEPGESTLRIEDTCSQPCCGNAELAVLQEDVENLNQDARGMLRTMQQLEAQLLTVETLKQAIDASGILGNDRGVDEPV